jgi:hypothetical protein
MNEIARKINKFTSIINDEINRSKDFSPISDLDLAAIILPYQRRRKRLHIVYDTLSDYLNHHGGQKGHRKIVRHCSHKKIKKLNKYYKTAKKHRRVVTRRRCKRGKKCYKPTKKYYKM